MTDRLLRIRDRRGGLLEPGRCRGQLGQGQPRLRGRLPRPSLAPSGSSTMPWRRSITFLGITWVEDLVTPASVRSASSGSSPTTTLLQICPVRGMGGLQKPHHTHPHLQSGAAGERGYRALLRSRQIRAPLPPRHRRHQQLAAESDSDRAIYNQIWPIEPSPRLSPSTATDKLRRPTKGQEIWRFAF